MSLFCREIMLYNEFVPAMEQEHHKWEYSAYGHYDGIGIGKIIKFDNSSSFEKMYINCAESDSENKSYTTQTLFGFFKDEEKEKTFWKADKPFLYIVLLQIEQGVVAPFYQNMRDDEYLKKLCSEIGLTEEQRGDILAQPYYSMDDTDFFLAIKCDYTSMGTEYINYLHQRKDTINHFQVKNSYSILGVRSEVIESGLPKRIKDEEIDMIELRAIEKEGGSIGQLYKELKEKFENDEKVIVDRLSLLGTEDEAVIITNISWRKLLPLYQKKDGILSNSYKKYTSAISTKVMFHIEDKSSISVKNSEMKMVSQTHICDKMCKLINEIYKDCEDIRRISEKKNLMMLVNSLCRFEEKNSLFADYNFFTLFMPLYVFLQLLKKNNAGNTIFYYEFMKSMRLRTQNFTKSDRVFSQIVDFNMRYFDVPTKFITLYSAYIYRFKNLLNMKGDKKYEFLICPGENGQMEVKEIMPRVSSKERLFLVGVPESQLYLPKLMCIMLGHEIAHFVGTNIRCRERRAESLSRMCARMITLSMKAYLSNESEINISWNETEEWEKCEETLVRWLDFYIERIKNEDYLKEYYYSGECYNERNLNFNKEYYCHTNMLKDTLSTSIAEFLQERGKNTFGFAIQNMYEREANTEKNKQRYFEEMSEKLQECINDFVAPVKKGNNILNIHGGLDQFIYLMKECYADVVCILTLHLPLVDYLQAFVSNLKEIGRCVDEIADTILIARIAIVMSVICYPRENEQKKHLCINEKEKQVIWGWNDAELENIKQNSECLKLEEVASQFSENYIALNHKVVSGELINNVVEIIYDQKILREIIKYLLRCRAEFYNEILVSHCNKDLDDIIEFYRTVQTDNTENMFSEMGKIISEYEKDIRAEMGEI